MEEPSGDKPLSLIRTYVYVLAALIGGIGAIGVGLGTELWHIAVGTPLLMIAAVLLRVVKKARYHLDKQVLPSASVDSKH